VSAGDVRRGPLQAILRAAEAVLLLLGVVGLLWWSLATRGPAVHRGALTLGPGAATVGELQDAAATKLSAALAKGGSGISFEIVQRATVTAKPGGRPVPIPDPDDPEKVLGYAPEVFANALIERGTATADGFYSEIRTGPPPDAAPDWNGTIKMQALTLAGKTYRNEGDGWYPTTRPPGVGLDPVTVRLLPSLIRNATAAADAGVDPADPSVREITATGAVADMPGVIAADGAAFTKLRGPVTFGLDPDGRLTKLHLVALNTNLTEFDLVVVTDVALTYGAGELPKPEPAYSGPDRIVVP
jgi:hypothetical protein